MSTIKINELPVEVIRSARRKTIAIKIQDGQVSIHLPKLMPLWMAKQFIARKQPWIEKKLQQFHSRAPTRQFTDGELQPYAGESYPLRILYEPQRQRIHIRFEHQQFQVKAPSNVTALQIRQALARWYRRQADENLTERARQLASQLAFHPRQIQIKPYKSRWGSCTLRGDIQLNWQLIQAPPVIMDYVIIHELCHLQHHNHSKAFWDLVEKHDPHYRTHRHWLKQHGYQLVI